MKGLIFTKKVHNSVYQIKIIYAEDQQSIHIFIEDFIEYIIQTCKSEEQNAD